MSIEDRSDSIPDYLFELLRGIGEKVWTKTYAKKTWILMSLFRIKNVSRTFFLDRKLGSLQIVLIAICISTAWFHDQKDI